MSALLSDEPILPTSRSLLYQPPMLSTKSYTPLRRWRSIAAVCVVFFFVFLVLTRFDRVHQIPFRRPDSVTSVNTVEEIVKDHKDFLIIPEPLIPHKIWQIFLPPLGHTGPFRIPPDKLGDSPSWLALNPAYDYTLVSQVQAELFLRQHFGHDEHLMKMYESLDNPGLKTDMLRYLLLSIEGGIYTDTDTVALKPIDEWVPEHIRNRTRLIVGIEYDRLGASVGWAHIPHYVQFCQWTIAASSSHMIFERMVQRIQTSLEEIAAAHNASIGQGLSAFEVMNTTGPAAWTDVVFERIQEVEPSITDIADLSGMKEPTLFDDILVLPIDGFGMGQPHSNSTNDGTIPDNALLSHRFRGSWRDSNQGLDS
ncbi:alpha-1,6-mannosyltransferase Och1 [Xylariaceae sp. FL0255]|nr:alpha-1,6-mannosyltransferase Och1 [Xylariaceae sp. FL0255]